MRGGGRGVKQNLSDLALQTKNVTEMHNFEPKLPSIKAGEKQQYQKEPYNTSTGIVKGS